ncbi:NAC domain-containing protein 2-like isoform X1 [Actinidia eriantha]|uniref:NAC domain-containing protein 2-like isoform X1 n=1 Tax=Actinidia eriantha TaxID=165200 RepID=UPI0025879ACD|nr:NAC domain-containing protein 2-like isoform X1 [Actinidia eriantha]
MEVEADDEGDNYFLSLPAGYWFEPTDTELVMHYLYNKVSDKPLPRNRIRDVNIYSFHPQELARMYPLLREIHRYFFTPTETMFPNGVRPKRANSDGYWKQTIPNKHIMYENKIVGYKMSLDFYEGGHRNGRRTEWKMHEYRIHTNSPPPPKNSNAANSMKLDGWVLCKLYSKSQTTKSVQGNQITKLAAARFPNLYRLSSGDNDEL